MLLRLWHVAHGLPDFLEEAVPFRTAFGMWGWEGRADLNPHEFSYPSLTFYLELTIQKLEYFAGHLLGRYLCPEDYLASYFLDPSPMVIPARLVQVLADVVSMVCAARIAERVRRGSGWLAALFVACAPSLILTSRMIYTDTLMIAFALAALDRLLAWRERGGDGRLIACALLMGFAVATKYTAAVLVVPLGVVLIERRGPRGLGRLVALSALMLAVLLVTSAYLILDFNGARQSLAYLAQIGAHGILGNRGGSGAGYDAHNLVRDLGWPGVALAVLACGFVPARARREGAALAVLIALAAFAVPIALSPIEVERYLVEVTPFAAVLAAAAATEIVRRGPARHRRLAFAVVGSIAIAPALAHGVTAARGGARSTQIEARRWCEANLAANDVLIEERYGARLRTHLSVLGRSSAPWFGRVREQLQSRLLALPAHHVVVLPLASSGVALNRVTGREGAVRDLVVLARGTDLNDVFYDPRLYRAADFVLTSETVRGRYEADASRYVAECEFYRRLDQAARIVARFRASTETEGPNIVIYRCDGPARATMGCGEPFDLLWWAGAVAPGYRRSAQSLLTEGPDTGASLPGGSDGSSAPTGRAADAAPRGVRDAEGEPESWVRSLSGFYADHVRPFMNGASIEFANAGQDSTALLFSGASLAMNPGDEEAALVYLTAAGRLSQWAAARAVVERALVDADANEAWMLRLEHATVLEHLGEGDSARAELMRAARGPAGDPSAEEARRRLARAAGMR
ncbi:MAG: glycosyltransferase family 39 protein [Candidatus Eisenbacteria bacterium]|nr:glycosyltransferase family 39 protein [Candidatus Eisenbacteria bacterium]